METIDSTYYYKGNPYRIFAQSKMKVDGVWIDCIIYQCLYLNPDGDLWVRTKEEFFNLFTTEKWKQQPVHKNLLLLKKLLKKYVLRFIPR